jgi:hypothetical protein
MTILDDPDAPARDCLSEMSALINAALPDGEYVAPLVAHDLVEKLRVNDPDLLAGWLWERAEVTMTAYISDRIKNRRNASRESLSRSAFAGAAERFAATGDGAAMREAVVQRPFDAEHVVNEGLLRRKVAEMTGEDHLFVAKEYADTKQTAALLESFHRAVAKKVGKRKTKDVFTEVQYVEMYQSITRRELAA